MDSQSPTTYSLIALEAELKDITPNSIQAAFAKVKKDLESSKDDAVKTSANDLQKEIERSGSRGLSEDGVSFLNKLRRCGNLQESDTVDASAGKTTATPIEDKAKEDKITEIVQSDSRMSGSSRQPVGIQTLKPTTDNRPSDPNQQINKSATMPTGSSAQQTIADSRENDPSQEVLQLLKKCLSPEGFDPPEAIKDLPKQPIVLEIIKTVNKLKEENVSNSNKIAIMEEQLKSEKNKFETLEKEKKDEEDKNKQRLANSATEMVNMEKKYNEFYQQQQVSIDQKNLDIGRLQTTKGQLQKSITNLEDKHRNARKETEGWQNQFQQLTEDCTRQQQKTSEEIHRLQGENKQLKSRVSELAGAKLMDNNPDIADLSDPNRALKLGEKFSGLYDDDWTDAFQCYTEKFNMKEGDAIQQLLHVLMKTYEFCRKVAGEQMDCLCNVFDNPCQDIPKALTMKAQKEKAHISQKQYKDLKDLRKQIALKKTDSISKQYVSKEYEEVKKGDKKLKSMLDETKSYYEKCVEVCWPMVLHDPPVRMDPTIKQGVKIDPNRFRLYGGNGDVLEYLVWPPLLVEGGGLLAKGVAKPKKVQRVVKKP